MSPSLVEPFNFAEGDLIYGFEHQPVTLSCPGYDESFETPYKTYRWFKHEYKGEALSNRVAFYHSTGGNEEGYRTEGALLNRASLNTNNGELTINSLLLSDQHWYTCYFTYRAKVFLYGK